MKTLWTPWRMQHVLGQATTPAGCLFEPVSNKRSAKEELLLYQDRDVVVKLNRFPYANGHLLIAPVRHCGCLTELEPEELHRLTEMVQAATAIIKNTLNPDGINIGLNLGAAAGAGIEDHLHYHLVPRWQDDHNFMTVLAEIRAIPEHIEVTFDRLVEGFNTLHQD